MGNFVSEIISNESSEEFSNKNSEEISEEFKTSVYYDIPNNCVDNGVDSLLIFKLNEELSPKKRKIHRKINIRKV